jgi:hypothetical protein
MIHPDFENWSRESLVQFAKESYDHLIDDTILINALKQDLKAAIKAYRYINTRTTNEQSSTRLEKP